MSNFVLDKVFLRRALLHYFNMKKIAASLVLPGKNLIFCIWWDQHDLLRAAQTEWKDHGRNSIGLNSCVCAARWSKNGPQFEERHDKVIFQHDNDRLHVEKPVKTFLEMLKWEVLPHPTYSPNNAPSAYYYLFRSMTHSLSQAEVHFIWTIQKMCRCLDYLKGLVVLSSWYTKITRKMGKSSDQRWTIFWITYL